MTSVYSYFVFVKAKLGSSCHCFERIGKKREKRGKIEKKGERVRWLFETPNRFGDSINSFCRAILHQHLKAEPREKKRTLKKGKEKEREREENKSTTS